MTSRTFKLTEHQIFFACALTNKPQTVSAIKKQAFEDGYCGNYGNGLQRVSHRKLVALGIAEGDEYSLKRGKNWKVFYDEYGEQATKSGLRYYSIEALFFPKRTAEIIAFPLNANL